MKIAGTMDSCLPLAIADAKKPAQSRGADETIKGQESKTGTFCGRDTIEISKEAQKQVQKEAQKKADEMKDMREQMENARKSGDAIAKSFKIQSKCMLIASRIISGDEVPPQDYRYLAENNSEMYGRALCMRIEKTDPVKHKQLSEDENDDVTGQAEATNAKATVEPEISAETSIRLPAQPPLTTNCLPL